MWLRACPNIYDQGQVRPLVTESGPVVLSCDSCGAAWSHPDEISADYLDFPVAPFWLTRAGVSVAPGKTRWAQASDVEALDWDVEWREVTWDD